MIIGKDTILQPRRFDISIVGLGKLGAALASQLEGCTVRGWDVVDTGLDIQTDTLYDCIKDTDAIFIVVPSQHFETTVTNIIREYSEHRNWHDAVRVSFISFTKGFCGNRLPIQILRRQLPFNPCGVISGPMLSAELYHDTTHTVLATSNMDIFNTSAIATKMGNLKIYTSNDEIGVTLCGILKNIYAIGMGTLHDCTDNMRACFVTGSLNEMRAVIDTDTVLSYAGVGDLLATCYSTKSRNYTYGQRMLRRHDTNDIMSEGANNIDELIAYLSVDLPIVNAIKSCLMCRSAVPLQTLLYTRHALTAHP